MPDLVTAFMGREVGAKALVKLNGIDHEVELLAIRQPPAATTDDAAGADESTAALASAEVAGNA